MRREIARPIPKIGAIIVIFEFYEDEGTVHERQDCGAPAGVG